MNVNLKQEINAFFLECGIDARLSHGKIEKELKKRMGRSRYNRYLDLGDMMRARKAPVMAIYECKNTLQEANLLITLQAEIFVEVSAQIYTIIKPFLCKGATIGDLGCYTGAFLHWLASHHQDCLFFGFDRYPKSVAFTNELNKNSNACGVVWDYTALGQFPSERCDLLVCSFGIDFDLSIVPRYSLDVTNLRYCQGYRVQTKEAYQYFSCWREAINPGGKLVTVLRIPGFDHLLALVDAAMDAGWGLDLASSKRICSDGESFPLLVFLADQEKRVTQKELMAFWHQNDHSPGGNVYTDCRAIERYLSLPNKVVIKEKKVTYPGDGHTMLNIIGRSGDLGYFYRRATTDFTELTIVPHEHIGTLKLIDSEEYFEL